MFDSVELTAVFNESAPGRMKSFFAAERAWGDLVIVLEYTLIGEDAGPHRVRSGLQVLKKNHSLEL